MKHKKKKNIYISNTSGEAVSDFTYLILTASYISYRYGTIHFKKPAVSRSWKHFPNVHSKPGYYKAEEN